jgi:hypothetical protein
MGGLTKTIDSTISPCSVFFSALIVTRSIAVHKHDMFIWQWEADFRIFCAAMTGQTQRNSVILHGTTTKPLRKVFTGEIAKKAKTFPRLKR